MDDQMFSSRLSDLMGQIEQLPSPAKEELHRLAEETKSRHERMRRTLGDLQESLDYLRLSTKYLVFDLEATRRENRYLRRLLEEKGQH